MRSAPSALQLALPLDGPDDERPDAAVAVSAPGGGDGGEALPGTILRRDQVTAPRAYAVVDCETTGTDPDRDEIVSIAIVRLDPDGLELARLTTLVRPSIPIPAGATAVHGIGDDDVADAPAFAEIAARVMELVDDAVFVAHNVGFDLPIVRNALARAGLSLEPGATACTLEAFRLLEPRAENHRLESLCERHGIVLDDAHQALGDVLATASLLRELLARGLAPESARLDRVAYQRLRSRGDLRPASDAQVRRVFGLARAAGLVDLDGAVDRERVVSLVRDVAGVEEPDALTREQVQDVFDALDELAAGRAALAAGAHPAAG